MKTKLILILLVFIFFRSGASSADIDRATYVYEKDQTAVPVGVAAGLLQLNKDGEILASEFEQSSVDGDGQVPEQYKIALAAAKEAGLPALVIQAGDKVVRVVKAPKSIEQVLESVK